MDPIAAERLVAACQGKCLGPIPTARITGISTDSRSIAPGDAFFALVGETFDGHDYIEKVIAAGASIVIASRPEAAAQAQARGWPVVRVDDTVAALGRLAAWYRSTLAARLIAVTGSNGKTTTKTMLAGVLAKMGKVVSAPKSFNNSIGVPLTLLSAPRDHEYVIVELGTNHPGEIAALAALARPDLAVICSIGAAHIEGLGGLDGVAREKASLLAYVAADGFAAINVDEPALAPHLRAARCQMVRFGAGQGADLRAESIETDGRTLRFRVNGRWPVQLCMAGRHNAINALGAWAVASRLGMAPEQIAEALSQVRPPEMRLQQLRYGSVTVLNDAYNANPSSMVAGLRTLTDMPVPPNGRRVAIVADMLELGPQSKTYHEQVGRLLADLAGIDCLVAVGAMAHHLADAAQCASAAAVPGHGTLTVHRFADAEQAAGEIAQLLRPGDLVLLKGSRGMRLEKLIPPIQHSFVAGPVSL